MTDASKRSLRTEFRPNARDWASAAGHA